MLLSSDNQFTTTSVIKISKFLSYFDSTCFFGKFYNIMDIFVVR